MAGSNVVDSVECIYQCENLKIECFECSVNSFCFCNPDYPCNVIRYVDEIKTMIYSEGEK